MAAGQATATTWPRMARMAAAKRQRRAADHADGRWHGQRGSLQPQREAPLLRSGEEGLRWGRDRSALIRVHPRIAVAVTVSALICGRLAGLPCPGRADGREREV